MCLIKLFEKLLQPKQKDAAYLAKEIAMADVANWLSKLPHDAIVQARQQDRVIVVEVVT